MNVELLEYNYSEAHLTTIRLCGEDPNPFAGCKLVGGAAENVYFLGKGQYSFNCPNETMKIEQGCIDGVSINDAPGNPAHAFSVSTFPIPEESSRIGLSFDYCSDGCDFEHKGCKKIKTYNCYNPTGVSNCKLGFYTKDESIHSGFNCIDDYHTLNCDENYACSFLASNTCEDKVKNVATILNSSSDGKTCADSIKGLFADNVHCVEFTGTGSKNVYFKLDGGNLSYCEDKCNSCDKIKYCDGGSSP